MENRLWIYDPSILLDKDELMNLWPQNNMSSAEKMNAIARIVILLTFIGCLLTKNLNILLIGIITLVSSIFYYIYYLKDKKSEEFSNIQSEVYPIMTNPNAYQEYKQDYQQPSQNNPMANLLIPEIYYNPERKPAAPTFNPSVEEEINEIVQTNVSKKFDDPEIKQKLFANLGDALEFNRSMTRFTATANQEVPNDREDFAEFCYGDMISGKEGNPLALERNQSGAVNYRNI